VGNAQTTPTNSGGSGTAVGGVQTLPSTSTGASAPLAAIGGILMAIGAYLLRRPSRRIG
jgi:LPXTG-motif cell wall-anchored protein